MNHPKVPKIIHQTWKTEVLPPEFQKSKDSWTSLNPDFEYILWTDDMNRNLIISDFPWFLEQYDAYEYTIQRVDAIRYFILWKYGGIYCDLDVMATKPISEVLDELHQEKKTLAFVVSGNLQDTISNWLMFSTKENPFWKEVFEGLKESFQNKNCSFCYGKHLKVIYSTGPGMINYVVRKSKYRNEISLFNKHFNPCNVCDPKPCFQEDSYIAHLNGQTWNEWDSLLFNTAYCYQNYIFLTIAVIIIILFLLLI